MNWLGDYNEDGIVYVVFTTAFNGVPTDPDAALTNADITIVREDGTLKATANGTSVQMNVDGQTGIHAIGVDTGNDTGDAGYWATSRDYAVRIEGVLLGFAFSYEFTFSIENRMTGVIVVTGADYVTVAGVSVQSAGVAGVAAESAGAADCSIASAGSRSVQVNHEEAA